MYLFSRMRGARVFVQRMLMGTKSTRAAAPVFVRARACRGEAREMSHLGRVAALRIRTAWLLLRGRFTGRKGGVIQRGAPPKRQLHSQNGLANIITGDP